MSAPLFILPQLGGIGVGIRVGGYTSRYGPLYIIKALVRLPRLAIKRSHAFHYPHYRTCMSSVTLTTQ